MKTIRDWNGVFRDDVDADADAERRLLVKELVVVAFIAALVVLRQVLL